VLSPLSGAGGPAPVADQLRRALASAAALERPGRAFLVVAGAPAPDAEASRAAFAGWASAAGVPGQVVQTPPIVDDAELGLHGPDQTGVVRLLAALHAVKREIDERTTGFFDYQSIRHPVSAAALLPLARAEGAARGVVQACAAEGTEPRAIAPDAVVSVAELCEAAAMVHGAAVLPVGPEVALTAIDRLFAERARGFADPAAAAAGAPLLEGDALEALIATLKRRQDDCLARERGRAAHLLAELERHTIDRPGGPLTYLAVGAGERLFLLNALGQRLRFWTRLIVQLAQRYRIVIWEPRGLDGEGADVLLDDQVGDVEAVARSEGADRIGLVGWCTGPKVAIEYHLRNPGAVSAIAMLNPSFKCAGSPEELDTDYEHDFEPICRTLVRRPAMAASLVSSLGSGDDADPPLALEGDPLASAVLASMNRELRAEVRAPFRSAPVLARYARQIHDFWSYDARARAPRVTVPVLLIASQYDRVASPESARLAAGLFPRGELVWIEGATHYCLYDNPELIGELLEDFMERCA
jgi:pimeloyl-ACP methyl ester carboxylesterase